MSEVWRGGCPKLGHASLVFSLTKKVTLEFNDFPLPGKFGITFKSLAVFILSNCELSRSGYRQGPRL